MKLSYLLLLSVFLLAACGPVQALDNILLWPTP